jgi:hypothetical protein
VKISVACSDCGKRYQIDQQMEGKRAKCAQCGSTFTVHRETNDDAADHLFGDLPTDGVERQQAGPGALPDATPPPPTSYRAGSQTPAGPTDRQFRLGAAALIPLVLLGMAGVFFGASARSLAAVVVVGLGPFAIFYGIAALIDPNIVRAAGKFGTHLPRRYKLIAGLVGIAALACSLPLSYLMLTMQ